LIPFARMQQEKMEQEGRRMIDVCDLAPVS
jgi:hypothetical protein